MTLMNSLQELQTMSCRQRVFESLYSPCVSIECGEDKLGGIVSTKLTFDVADKECSRASNRLVFTYNSVKFTGI